MKISNRSVFIALWAAIIVSRLVLFFTFNFKFVGNDDLIFWQGTTDYLAGIFHEPYFYGQNYNLMLDAVFAAPFVYFGIPIYIVFPLVSGFIGLFPFFLFSKVLFNRNHIIPSFLFALIALGLPVEYDIITSITRGFTSGLFFTGFLVFPLLKPKRVWSYFALGLLVSLAFIFNPNALLFAFPIAFYLWMTNIKNWKFYIYFIIGSLPVLIGQYLASKFYVDHPEFLVFYLPHLKFSWNQFVEAFDNLDKYYRYLTPMFWGGNWLVLLIIIALGWFVIVKDKWKGLSILLTSVLILISLGVNKVNDDLNTIFFSSVRMFLAVPLVYGLSLFWMKDRLFLNEKFWRPLIILGALVVFCVKLIVIGDVVAKETEKRNFIAVGNIEISELQVECKEITQVSDSLDIDVIIFVSNWDFNYVDLAYYSYGCDVIEPRFPPNVLNLYERRTWRFEEEKSTFKNNVLIYGGFSTKVDSINQIVDCELISSNPNMILLKNNRWNAAEIGKAFGFPYKRSPYFQ